MVKLPIAVPLVALVLGAGLLSLGAERYGTAGMPPRFEAFRAAVNATTEQTEIQVQLQEYKGHHPADIFADLVVAKRLTELGAPRRDVLARVNVGMNLQPHFAEPHLLASQILFRYGAKEQAVGEYLRAFRKNSHVAWTFSENILRILRLPNGADDSWT